MSTNKREAEDADHPAQGSGSASQSHDKQNDSQEQPAIKRVKLDETQSSTTAAASSSNTLASDPVEVSPSSPLSSHVKSRNERSTGDGHRGRGRGGKGRGARADNGKGKGRDRDRGRDRNSEMNEKGKGRETIADGNGDATAVNGGNAEGAQDDAEGSSKLPKKKVAMLIGYSGLGYSGLQINPGVKTIEAEIFEACVKAGAVSEDNSDNPNKVSLMRAARTDAGVSAAINVLNLKLILNPPNKPEDLTLEAYINTFLPDNIRVWSIIRVQGGFHSRTMCDSRMYNYSLPTYCFLEPRPETAMSKRVTRQDGEKSWWDEHKAEGGESSIVTVPDTNGAGPSTKADSGQPEDAATTDPAGPSRFREDQTIRKAYRVPEEVLARIRQTIETFKGSHNFWNYTVGKEFADRSCQRIMKKLTVTEPFMVNDQEWISLKFHGQSFMLHQIRKMVALVIFCVRTRTPPSLILETFGPARLNIPKAPALGLLLEQPHFDSYDKKVIDSNKKIQQRLQKMGKTDNQEEQEADESLQLRDTIDYSAIAQEVEQFERTVILRSMYDEEAKEDTYALWLSLHDGQLGTDFDYLNAKGIIPQSAILGKNRPAVPKGQPSAASGVEAASGAAASPGDANKSRNSVAPLDEEDAQLASQNQGKGAAELDG